MSGYNEEGYVNQFAPATEGDQVIVNNGDGTYQLTFSFLDDLGHTWDGTWSGTITADNYDFCRKDQMTRAPKVFCLTFGAHFILCRFYSLEAIREQKVRMSCQTVSLPVSLRISWRMEG